MKRVPRVVRLLILFGVIGLLGHLPAGPTSSSGCTCPFCLMLRPLMPRFAVASAAPASAPITTTRAADVPGRKVAARVNGQAIYEDELHTAAPKDAFEESMDAARDVKLGRLTELLAMEQFFNRENIEVPQAEIDAEIAKLRVTPPSAGCPCCRYSSLEEYMDMNFVSMSELARMSRRGLGFQKYLDAAWQKAYPKPEDRAALLKVKRPLLEAKFAKAHHIFFNVMQDPAYEDDADGVTKKKRALCEAAWKRLERGEDFAAVAKAVSEDKVSAPEGGALGPVPKGAYGEDFSKVLFGLKPGAYSKPVESSWGWHIVRRDTLTDEDLLGMLKSDFQDKKGSDVLDALQRDTKIERAEVAPAAAGR